MSAARLSLIDHRIGNFAQKTLEVDQQIVNIRSHCGMDAIIIVKPNLKCSRVGLISDNNLDIFPQHADPDIAIGRIEIAGVKSKAMLKGKLTGLFNELSLLAGIDRYMYAFQHRIIPVATDRSLVTRGQDDPRCQT